MKLKKAIKHIIDGQKIIITEKGEVLYNGIVDKLKKNKSVEWIKKYNVVGFVTYPQTNNTIYILVFEK